MSYFEPAEIGEALYSSAHVLLETLVVLVWPFPVAVVLFCHSDIISSTC